MIFIMLAMNQNCDHNLYDDAGEMIVVSSEWKGERNIKLSIDIQKSI